MTNCNEPTLCELALPVGDSFQSSRKSNILQSSIGGNVPERVDTHVPGFFPLGAATAGFEQKSDH